MSLSLRMTKDQTDFEISFFGRLVKGHPDFVDALIPLAEAYTRKGCHEKALVIDKRLAALKKEDPLIHYNLACSFSLLGRKEEALRSLAQAIDLGYDDFEHLKKDSDFKIFQDDPRFQALISAKKT